jgi:hypothetical protein
MEKVMVVESPPIVLGQSNTRNNGDALGVLYESQIEACLWIKLIEKHSGKIHEFSSPLFGSLILEHDGFRTSVHKLGLWGNKVASFTTYDVASLEVNYA